MTTDYQEKPNEVKKINKSKIVVIFIFLLSIALFAILFILHSQKEKELAQKDELASSSILPDNLNMSSFIKLPGSYDEISNNEERSNKPTQNLVQREKVKPKKKEVKPEPQKMEYQDVDPNKNRVNRTLKVARVKTQEEIERDLARKSGIFFAKNEFHQEKTATKPEGDFENSQEKFLENSLRALNQKVDFSETRINQKNKQKYLSNTVEGAVYLSQQIQDPVSPYQIMAGTILPAVLISGINSDLPGHIIAQVRENIYDTVDGAYLLIPQGTRLFGSYDNMVTWGQDKVMLAWSRIIFPNGASIVLNNMPGMDLSGYAGLKDKVNNHYKKLAGAIFMSTFLSVGSRRIAGDVSGENPTVSQEMAADISTGINRAGQRIVSRQLNVPPTLEIKPGFPFNVMVTKDIILRPYR